VRTVNGLMFYSICAGSTLFPPGQKSNRVQSSVQDNLVVFPPFQNSCPSGLSCSREISSHSKIHLANRRSKDPSAPTTASHTSVCHALKTNLRGASKTLVTTIRSISLTVCLSSLTSVFFHLINNHSACRNSLPRIGCIISRPVADCLYRSGLSVHTLSRPRFVLITIRARTGRQYVLKNHLLRSANGSVNPCTEEGHVRVVRSLPAGLDQTKPQRCT